MRGLILAVLLLVCAAPALSHPPATGDVFSFDRFDTCGLIHFDVTTGLSHVVSSWANGMCVPDSVVGTGSTN